MAQSVANGRYGRVLAPSPSLRQHLLSEQLPNPNTSCGAVFEVGRRLLGQQHPAAAAEVINSVGRLTRQQQLAPSPRAVTRVAAEGFAAQKHHDPRVLARRRRCLSLRNRVPEEEEEEEVPAAAPSGGGAAGGPDPDTFLKEQGD